MRTAARIFVILALSLAVALGLFMLVDSQFSMSMGPGGISPGFQWLLSLRADQNGGRIAPSFAEMQASGSLPPFMQGAGGAPGASRSQGAALSQGFDPAKALGAFGRDLALLAVAAVAAGLVELVLFNAIGALQRFRR